MTSSPLSRRAFAAGLASISIAPRSASAQGAGTIKIIAPFPAGGSIDAISRLVQPGFPNIPAFVEAGGPQLDASIWYAIWAPVSTPADLVSKIRRIVKGSLTSPAVARAWEIQGAEIPNVKDEEIVGFVERERAEWTKTVTELGIKVD